VCCGWLDVGRSRFTVALAGHHRPLLLDGGVRELDVPYGPALGLFEAARWQPVELKLPPDWGLLLYTDGLVEARAGPGLAGRFGLERLSSLLAGGARQVEIDHEQLALLVQKVRDVNGGPLADDVALLYVAPRRLAHDGVPETQRTEKSRRTEESDRTPRVTRGVQCLHE
jgi:serine phosphatase RsbU (regulator of sigma subunit)